MATKKKGPEPLSAATIKNLHDKLYDKRKLGAVEVEVQVRELRASGQGQERIVDILTYLNDSFIASGSMSSRKGGLIAFAAAALGLGGVRPTLGVWNISHCFFRLQAPIVAQSNSTDG